jgi:hypothetical protein
MVTGELIGKPLMRYLGWGERQARSVANPAARLIGSSSKPDAPAVKREAEEDWG